MDLQLKNKFALVTGSTSGIGEGIAKALAQEGAAVVVHGAMQPKQNGLCMKFNRLVVRQR